MAEFRIGKLGKKILLACIEKDKETTIGDLMYEVYDCKDDEPFNDASDYREYNYDKFKKLTFSQKVSLYNSVKRLEKRKFVECRMVYNRWGHMGSNYIAKYVKITKLGEEYISKHLIHDGSATG